MEKYVNENNYIVNFAALQQGDDREQEGTDWKLNSRK